MYKLFKKLIKLWPVIILGIFAWFLQILWLNENPRKIVLSNSIEAKDVLISSKVPGRIAKVFIQEGSQVKKGQILLELDGDEIKAQLEQAKASLKKSIYELTDLKKGARSQEISQSTASTLMGKALLEEAKLKYENTINDFNRLSSLYQSGAISKQKLDSIETQKNVAEKDVKNHQEEYNKAIEMENLVKEGPRKDQVYALNEQVNFYKAKVEELEKYVSELKVTSPINGEVSSFDLKTGELIKANQILLTVTDLNDLYIRVYIPNTQLSKISLNQRLKVEADPFPGLMFDGYISYIGANAEFTPRNIQTVEERTKLVYPVKIIVTNKTNKLRNGMYASVKL